MVLSVHHRQDVAEEGMVEDVQILEVADPANQV